jgi:hypothetical protein
MEGGPMMAMTCSSSNFHPFECEGAEGGCVHCIGEDTDDHDTMTCALCNYDDEEHVAELRAELRAERSMRIEMERELAQVKNTPISRGSGVVLVEECSVKEI